MSENKDVKEVFEVEEFERWNEQKQVLNFSKKKSFFLEREIRWVYFGKNISSEIFGKGSMFSRPVLILRKLYGHSCFVVPLTSKSKKGSYYYNFVDSRNEKHCAILCQMKYIDGARIRDKIGHVSKNEFQDIKKAVIQFIDL